jgi:hypothetical protein
MKKLTQVALILLALVPAIVTSLAFYPTIQGKVIAYRLIAFIISLGFFVLLLGKQKYELLQKIERVGKSRIFICMTILMGIIALSTITAFDPHIAFFGDLARGEGFLTLFSLYMLYFGAAVFLEELQWKWFFALTSVVSIGMLFSQIVQIAPGLDRPEGWAGNPIFVSSWYLFAIFAAYHTICMRSKRNPWMFILGATSIGASVFGILLAKTRGTLLAIGISLIISATVAVIVGKVQRIGKFSVRTIGIWFGGIVVGFALLFGITRQAAIWQRIPGLNRAAQFQSGGDTVQSRLLFLKISEKGFIQSSFERKAIGWGWDNYRYFWNKNYDPAVYVYDQANADRAHNKIADMFIATGVLGLLIYLTLWVVLMQKVFHIIRTNVVLGLGLLFTLIAYFIHNLFAFDVPVTLAAFYALVAYINHHEN